LPETPLITIGMTQLGGAVKTRSAVSLAGETVAPVESFQVHER
jgi:hypothetical protein